MDVYGPLEARKGFSYISNQKMDILRFLLYKYRLVYGPLKPKTYLDVWSLVHGTWCMDLGVWTCMDLWRLKRVFLI